MGPHIPFGFVRTTSKHEPASLKTGWVQTRFAMNRDYCHIFWRNGMSDMSREELEQLCDDCDTLIGTGPNPFMTPMVLDNVRVKQVCRQLLGAMEEKRDLRFDLQAAYQQLKYLWNFHHGCPCGARLGSEHTHSHVTGCPTAKAVAALTTKDTP